MASYMQRSALDIRGNSCPNELYNKSTEAFLLYSRLTTPSTSHHYSSRKKRVNFPYCATAV